MDSSLSKADSPTQNRILAALSTEVQHHLFPMLEPCTLLSGRLLLEPREGLRYVFFPTDCMVALFYVMENGASTEFSVVGNEGLVGIAQFTGGDSTPSQAIVVSSGTAFRLPVQSFKNEFKHYGDLLAVILRYTQSLMTQIAQTAVCNRHHSVEQQLCRWLLLSLDRVSGEELEMTQEMIGTMLGVRREAITEAACKLQKLGVISYRRGHIKVMNRRLLESLSCECYKVVKTESDRLLARPFVQERQLRQISL